MHRKARTPTAIDLFCGSGGVTLGLKKAGFNVLGAVDIDVRACETFRANHPDVRLIERDIKKVSPSEFSDLAKDRIDLIAVCAPCQPFSSQNRARAVTDVRGELVLEALPFIEAFQPKMVFLENVPGLEGSNVFSHFTAHLKNLGYTVSNPLRIDAADLGVPQRRARMILVAAKGVSLELALRLAKYRRKTVLTAIGKLPEPPISGDDCARDPLHVARRHSALNVERLRHIPADGGGRDVLPLHLQLNCHKNAKRPSSFSDTYGRMKWNDVAPTLTTGCTDITRGRFAHPEQNRAITLREAARLQTFPDNYKFCGNTAEIAIQIGNAVPPQMMKVLAGRFVAALAAAELEHHQCQES